MGAGPKIAKGEPRYPVEQGGRSPFNKAW